MTTGASHIPPPATDPMDRNRFPIDPWRFTEQVFDNSDLGLTETLFAVSNGYIGMRGNVAEGRESHTHGTYVNGFHETWPIQHAEEAYGFAKVGQTIVNVPDAKVIRLYVDDEPLLLPVADLIEYDRTIDFRSGVLTRDVVWRTPAGKRVRLRTKRMVSFTQRHLAVITFEVTMLDDAAPIAISSQVLNRQDGEDEYHVAAAAMGEGFDPRQAERFTHRVLEPQYKFGEDGRIVLGYRCSRSKMTLATAVHHMMSTDNEFTESTRVEPDVGKTVYRIHAQPGVPVMLTKLITYHTSRGVPAIELVDRCNRTLARALDQGVDQQFDDQRAWLDDYWRRSDVEVAGQPAVQQALRWNLFQLAQAAARAEGTGIPAKGLTGSGYGGHYFWDTEIYVLPYLTYTSPWLARNALRFRYTQLDAARRRAAELSQRGAAFPWRTINGQEASAYYAAGTAQCHINADISYALSKYVAATGDDDFLMREAVDILVETARLWADLGFWRGNGDGQFHIHGVTGPDEYTTVVNDNLFTNVMARFNLRRAARAVRDLKDAWPEAHDRMVSRLGLVESEVDEWERAAEGMAIPFDEGLGIHPQDSHFLEREVWDLPRTPPQNRPLLLHYHPLVIYRFQVLKQADVVLATFLQGEHFAEEHKRANFEYYDPITTGDSTLSAIVQSIVAAEVGYHLLALRYFMMALFVDLADHHGNTTDGVHVASAGGVWSALVFGFGGMRDHGGTVAIDPRLPESWESLTYRLTLRGTRVRVKVSTDEVDLHVEEGDQATLTVRGKTVTVTRGNHVTVPIQGHGTRLGIPSTVGPLTGIRCEDGTIITATVPGAG